MKILACYRYSLDVLVVRGSWPNYVQQDATYVTLEVFQAHDKQFVY